MWFPSVEFGYFLPVAATLLWGGWLAGDGQATVGQVTAVTLYVLQLMGPVDELLSWLDEIQVGAASFARIIGIGDVPERPHRQRRAAGRHRDHRRRTCATPTARATTCWTASRIDLAPGERLAVVGPSGAGKSTLGRLLAGIHGPRTGRVEVGGVPLVELELDDLRGHVALVTQEHHVFVGSLADNLRLARPGASDDELREALAAVDALGWAERLPQGMDTEVGSGGLELTPPQAQQLALARLVLNDPHTLVLDEATSLLDPRAARHLERSLSAVLDGRTVVAIAHRLHTAHDADRVAVVEDGKVSEIGTHHELVDAGRPLRRAVAVLDGRAVGRARTSPDRRARRRFLRNSRNLRPAPSLSRVTRGRPSTPGAGPASHPPPQRLRGRLGRADPVQTSSRVGPRGTAAPGRVRGCEYQPTLPPHRAARRRGGCRRRRRRRLRGGRDRRCCPAGPTVDHGSASARSIPSTPAGRPAPSQYEQFDSRARGRRVTWGLFLPGRPPGARAARRPGRCTAGAATRAAPHDVLHADAYLADHVRRGGAPLALVSVDGGDAYWHPRRSGDDPLAMILDELLPRVGDLGAQVDRIGVLGYSMGGYGSLMLAREGEAGRLGGLQVAAAAASSPALFATRAASARQAPSTAPADWRRWGDLAAHPQVSQHPAARGLRHQRPVRRADPPVPPQLPDQAGRRLQQGRPQRGLLALRAARPARLPAATLTACLERGSRAHGRSRRRSPRPTAATAPPPGRGRTPRPSR